MNIVSPVNVILLSNTPYLVSVGTSYINILIVICHLHFKNQ
jgi:hypothetical protein